jgi:cytochrome P450
MSSIPASPIATAQTHPITALPSPPADPALGHLPDFMRDPLGFLQQASTYGDWVPLQLGDMPACLVSDPAAIEAILKDRSHFIKAQDLKMLQGLIGNGLVVSEGSFWQRQRRLVQPMFHHQRIADYGQIMVDFTRKHLADWQVGDRRNFHDEMMRLTLDIVMKTIFDRELSDDTAHRITEAFEVSLAWFEAQYMANLGGSPCDPALDRRYGQAIALLDESIDAMIQNRRSSSVSQDEPGNDLLSLLMAVEDADDGSRMSDRQLRDETATLILAGHETTANTLTFAALLLAQHPAARAALTAELQTVLAGRAPTVADLPHLRYTTMVIQEALRLYPPATDVTREAIADCEILGHAIPAGCTLIMSQWVMHHHDRYFDRPEAFEPERWENDLEKRLPRGVYFPFGDGPRICIGKSFAQMEAVLILATIAQTVQWELLSDQPIQLQPSLTLRPMGGLPVQLAPL